MALLTGSECQYIRCVKPSQAANCDGQFNHTFVEKQLKACGVMETVRIRSQTHPIRFALQHSDSEPLVDSGVFTLPIRHEFHHRMTYESFLDRYHSLRRQGAPAASEISSAHDLSSITCAGRMHDMPSAEPSPCDYRIKPCLSNQSLESGW